MLKRHLPLFLIWGFAALILVACGGARAESNNSTVDTGGPGNEVHMNDTKFVQDSITIRKGERITLIADTFMPHIISNGTWQNGAPKPAREPGAPAVDQVKIDGNDAGTIGPFDTAGTFQLYCTIHPGMNLTVVVE
jgi:plastocyanin